MTSRSLAFATLIAVSLAAADARAQKPESKAPVVRIDKRRIAGAEHAEVCVTPAPGTGVKDIELKVDSFTVAPAQRTGIAQAGDECPARSWFFTVRLNPGPNNFVVVATDSNETKSPPVVATETGSRPQPNNTLHVITVGIDRYSGAVDSLSFAVKDARAFADSLGRQAGNVFGTVHIDSLYNDDATKAGIVRAFQRVVENADTSDTFVFYYAGHGTIAPNPSTPKDTVFFLAPFGVTDLSGSSGKGWARLVVNGIPGHELDGLVANLPMKRRLLILDACNSGLIADYMGAEPERMLGNVRTAVAGVMAATQSSQAAQESSTLGHGLFTYALLENRRKSNERPQLREVADLATDVRQFFKARGEGQRPRLLNPASDFQLLIR